MKTPAPFPFTVCWDETTRLAVTNTMGLSVRDSVFLATHAPSPIKRLNVAMSPPVATSYSESQLRDDFFQDKAERLFCVATGNPGTGKSHLIRWLAREAGRMKSQNWHIVVIPRHAANLADVIRRILATEFSGETVNRIREELQRTSDLTPEGAKTRVLDELAFVLEPENRRNARLALPDDEIHREVILPKLPALLRDAAFRRHLQKQGAGGILDRLAQHLMGRRTERPAAGNLDWTEIDLRVSVAEIARAGADAKELASDIAQDSALRVLTATALNTALEHAGPALLGLRRGQLGAAVLDIRRQLHAKGKELILLIEDLSVSQGMDAELVEALLVKPSEEGGGVCPLRSIVGVTNEDFDTMRSNLRGRIDLAVDFQVPLGEADDDSEFSEHDLLAFASRYLDAARYGLADLDKWAGDGGAEPLPSFCVQSKCPNRGECHAAFGQVDGRGLYPFNATALARLYRKHTQDEDLAFNPRKFVDGVLRFALEKAAVQMPARNFPAKNFLEWYRLDGVGVDGQIALETQYREEAERARVVAEIYSADPGTAQIDGPLAAPLGLKGFAGRKRGGATAPAFPGPAPRAPVVSVQDEFDRWLGGEAPTDGTINTWRSLVKNAVDGFHEWDSDPWRGAYGQFESSWIGFEGQRTAQRGDIPLILSRRKETALALRTLKTSDRSFDASMRTAEEVASWVTALRKELQRYARAEGTKPVDAAIQVLAIGALMRGNALSRSDLRGSMRVIFEAEKEGDPSPLSTGKTPAWNRLATALQKNLPAVRSWLLDNYGAPKGLSVDTAFLDTAELLSLLQSASHRVRWDFDAPTSEQWPARSLAPLRDAVTAVQNFLPAALEEIRAEATKYESQLDQACGEKTPTELGRALRLALDRGREALVFSEPRLDEIRPVLDDLSEGRFDEQLKALRRVNQEKAQNAQIGVCAAVDMDAVKRLSSALVLAGRVLGDAVGKLRIQVAERGGANIPALEQDLRSGIKALRDDLERLIKD